MRRRDAWWLCWWLWAVLTLPVPGQLPFDCRNTAVGPEPPLPEPKALVLTAKLLARLEASASSPVLMTYRELAFEHRGVFMPQWCADGNWLAVEIKPKSRRVPYQLRLFRFGEGEPGAGLIVQDRQKRSVFYALRWSRRHDSREFCVISGGFQLYWGNAADSDSKTITVTPLAAKRKNIAQPCWLHVGAQDYLAFIQGQKLCIGQLSKVKTTKPRQLLRVWPLTLTFGKLHLESLSYFRGAAHQGKVSLLVCGTSSAGEGLFLVELNADLQVVARISKIGDGTYKLPEWNGDGTQALAYRVRQVARQSSAQELYLFIYTRHGSGDILSRAPTIHNREKQPEHDYLGPTWTCWRQNGKTVEGICHFFKKSETPQHFKLIYFSDNQSLNYRQARVDMASFPAAFGRGRRIAFAGNGHYRVAFVFYDPKRQKNILYLGLMNFTTTKLGN